MTRWSFEHGELLDAPADVLVCSANPFLTLSGGVGGAYAVRHGRSMQRQLDDWLAATGKRWVPRGTLIELTPVAEEGVAPPPYTRVLHAVAVDGMYESSVGVVRGLVERSLRAAAAAGGRSVALAALATGYGHLPPEAFGEAVRPLTARDAPGVERVRVVVRDAGIAGRIRDAVGG